MDRDRRSSPGSRPDPDPWPPPRRLQDVGSAAGIRIGSATEHFLLEGVGSKLASRHTFGDKSWRLSSPHREGAYFRIRFIASRPRLGIPLADESFPRDTAYVCPCFAYSRSARGRENVPVRRAKPRPMQPLLEPQAAHKNMATPTRGSHLAITAATSSLTRPARNSHYRLWGICQPPHPPLIAETLRRSTLFRRRSGKRSSRLAQNRALGAPSGGRRLKNLS